MIWIPATAPRCPTANARIGVGSGPGMTPTRNPAAARTSAAAVANSAEPCRASRPTTTRPPALPCAVSHAATPAVVRVTTATFIPFGPARTGPRSPAVPNSSGPAIRSASSSTRPGSPPIARARTSCSSARESASGSSAIQRTAASRRVEFNVLGTAPAYG